MSIHETTALLKEEIQFLRKDSKNKSIIIKNLQENRNLHLQNQDERNIH